MKKHHRHENDCLNCGTELQGHFCHVCGQENLHLKEPFWHFLSHSISHYFHFDEKFFATLKPLLTQPGQLTLDYLAGKRTRYLHPVSMYIFVSIVYFLVTPHLHPKEDKEVAKETVTEHKSTTSHATFDSSNTKTTHVVNKDSLLKKYEKQAVSDTPDALERGIVKSIAAQPLLKRAMQIDSLQKLNKAHPSAINQKKIDSLKAVAKADSEKMDDDGIDNLIEKSDNKGFWSKIHHIYKATKSPEFKKELEHYTPKIYFILMPLFALFLMWNFRRNHRYYVEHIVFTIHFFTAFFLFETIVEPINYFIFKDSGLTNMLINCAVIWYCYKALRAFYQRARWVTIRKMVTLFICYGIAFSISIGAISFIVYMITE